MMMCRIGHGNLVTVARDDVFIVLRAAPESEPVDKELGVHLWHALGQERGIQKVLSLLAQQGLSQMPEFALVKHNLNELHVIVRGTFNVLTLNHDGRYSSVGSDGAATWREYTQLPAAEFCIRGVPGLTIRGTEEFYLASGVTRVATICSLGWDDPEHPASLVEERETGDIAPVELGDAELAISQEPALREPIESEAIEPETLAPEPAVSGFAALEPEVEGNGGLAAPLAYSEGEFGQDLESEGTQHEETELEDSEFEEDAELRKPSFSDESASGSYVATQVIDKEALAAFAQDAAQMDASELSSELAPQPEPQQPDALDEGPSTADHTLTEQFQIPPTLPLSEAPPSISSDSDLLLQAIAPVPAPPLPETENAQPQSLKPAVESDSPAQARRVLQPLTESQTYMPAAVAPPLSEDSDNHSTLLTSNLVKMRAEMAGNPDGPTPSEPVQPAPPIPVIRMSNGVTIPLDRTILLGRAPEASRVSLRDLPRLVNVVSPNNDVSRTHAQVRVEGDFVLVTDLNSTNGVLLTEPGQPPRRLHPDEPAQLQPGVIVDLGDGVTFELEATP